MAGEGRTEPTLNGEAMSSYAYGMAWHGMYTGGGSRVLLMCMPLSLSLTIILNITLEKAENENFV